MNTLIVCLGYDLSPNGDIPLILNHRLKDTVNLLNTYPSASILCMGARTYREDNKLASQAAVMKAYLCKQLPKLPTERFMTEETSTSSIEQLCKLRELLDSTLKSHGFDKIIIIGSEFFTKRLGLYTRYIFGSIDKFEFISSSIPTNLRNFFAEAESEKLVKATEWLAHHKEGDYQAILKEQKEYEDKVKRGIVTHPRS